MQKVKLKQAGVAACIFILGWAGAVGYTSWRYDFDFTPWRKVDSSIFPLTQSIFKQQCATENDALMRAVTPGDNSLSAYSAALFGCLSDRTEALTHKLSIAVTSYSDLSCRMKADSEGRPDDVCKKALDERIRMHRSLKELSSEQ